MDATTCAITRHATAQAHIFELDLRRTNSPFLENYNVFSAGTQVTEVTPWQASMAAVSRTNGAISGWPVRCFADDLVTSVKQRQLENWLACRGCGTQPSYRCIGFDAITW